MVFPDDFRHTLTDYRLGPQVWLNWRSQQWVAQTPRGRLSVIGDSRMANYDGATTFEAWFPGDEDVTKGLSASDINHWLAE